MAPLSSFVFAASTLLAASVVTTSAQECEASTSATVIATIDNSTYFDTCAVEEEGVTFNVTTLFDVLNLTSSEFIQFCNSSTCLEPVHEMLHSIPSDCLIEYEGTERNLSEEVTALHDKCHAALGEEDDDDDDDMSMSMSMSMSMNMDGMDMGGSSSSSSSTTGSSAASSTNSGVITAFIVGLLAIATVL
ncbi:hypothetical protein PHYBOEH_002070 [Phytophthora boehmeriae]|uniref:Elicitin n=1 Tax=Phytophthora boehmeriae TaxID=109152 RepID=A0A8T1X673_9STRA|nr:hypothetical protein PHYBOEH_002070 [Phytophthora boehmeriae]